MGKRGPAPWPREYKKVNIARCRVSDAELQRMQDVANILSITISDLMRVSLDYFMATALESFKDDSGKAEPPAGKRSAAAAEPLGASKD